MNLRGAAHKAPDQEVPTPRMRRSTHATSDHKMRSVAYSAHAEVYPG